MNFKASILFLALNIYYCFPTFADTGLYIRVRNNTKQEVTLALTSSKKYIFANINQANVSQYQYIDNGFSNPAIELSPGMTRIVGKPIKIDSPSFTPLVSGFYTFTLTDPLGAFLIHCERDATLEDVGKSNHLSPETIPHLENEFIIVDGIKKPGIYPLLPNVKLTLVDAIKLAGGAMDGNWEDTAVADLERIHLMRPVNGKIENYRLDASYRKGVNGKDSNFLIKPGDKIIVPVYLN